MAKYEARFNGDFNDILTQIHDGILAGSASASYEDGSFYQYGEVSCAVRVYERYSMLGGNRVSMNVTVMGNGNEIFISAITSGGSQAVFFKMNTLGEKSFLDGLIDIVESYKKKQH